MQQELEELKQIQMEKQLQLKEAATRQKLLALKQQLKSDSRMPTTKHENACSSNATGNGTINLPVTSKTTQSEITGHTKANDNSVQLSVSMDGKWPSNIKSQKTKLPQHTTENSGNTAIPKQDKQLKYQTSTFSSLLPDTFKPISGDENSFITDHKPMIVLDDTKQATSPCKNETPTHMDKPGNENARSDLKSSDTEMTGTTRANATSTSQHKPVVKLKLAVPDMVKETEYMSALNKQKARVSRIRRAIHAAEVIQKAWRKYKQTHS